MRVPTISLAAAMLAVVLVAVDLTVIRWVHGPVAVAERLGLVLSLLPMANILPFFALALISGREKRPFMAGFLGCGSAAMLAHLACDASFPLAMRRAYFWPVVPFYQFFRACHLPGKFLVREDRTLYFSSYPAIALIYCLPQVFAAGLGGWIVKVIADSREAHPSPDGR